MSEERTAAQREAERAERARRRAGGGGASTGGRGAGGAGVGGGSRPPGRPRRDRSGGSGGGELGERAGALLAGVAALGAGLGKDLLGGADVLAGRIGGRGRLAGAITGLLLLIVAGFSLAGGGSGPSGSTDAAKADRAKADRAKPKPLPQLPGGGRRIFPDRRVVAFYGNPQDNELGILGIGPPSKMVAKLRKQAKGYARKTRPVLPALELISSVAAASPGDDGSYNIKAPAKIIDRYHRAARKAKALFLLDIQPGLVDFPTEARRLRKWLKEPDVGLALDPEWRIKPGQVPGQVIGSVTAAEVNATTLWLAKLVKELRLPEKLVVVHQFTEGMVTNPEKIIKRPGLVMTFNVDGFGARANKVSKYKALVADKQRFHHGFKLFYKEDTGLMEPKSVMALQPRPELIVYE